VCLFYVFHVATELLVPAIGAIVSQSTHSAAIYKLIQKFVKRTGSNLDSDVTATLLGEELQKRYSNISLREDALASISTFLNSSVALPQPVLEGTTVGVVRTIVKEIGDFPYPSKKKYSSRDLQFWTAAYERAEEWISQLRVDLIVVAERTLAESISEPHRIVFVIEKLMKDGSQDAASFLKVLTQLCGGSRKFWKFARAGLEAWATDYLKYHSSDDLLEEIGRIRELRAADCESDKRATLTALLHIASPTFEPSRKTTKRHGIDIIADDDEAASLSKRRKTA
jgi:hypothetical protein